jgi:hypothetical protein
MLSDTTITEKQLRPLKIICLAIPLFGTMFWAIVLFVGGAGTEPSHDLSTIRIIHIVMTLASLITSKFVADKVLAGTMEAELLGKPQISFLQKYQSYAIIQLAVIEGAVLFGGVILIQAPPSVVQADPTYYLHILPLALLWVRALQLSPTIDKLEQLSRRYNSNA